MKTKISLLIIAIMLTIGFLHAQSKTEMNKMLIVYFSWSNDGNTRNMAEQIKAATNADIHEIKPVTPYPRDYNACVEQAKKEVNAGYQPPLKTKVDNISEYDIIFVGSPNWWATIAPPVATFLSSYNFEGKTIVPFITHEGSRMGRSVSDIKKLCPNSTILEGLPVRGGSVRSAGNDIKEWLRKIKMIK
ncbi:MAG: NAD(P)H-dependent oxidoreductase [Emcibacter sp.]|nr:NAD(P)H-dependent oxidoreductase [Labilibaculum sp.]MBL4803015.1 NAD(P)H-dependent oxidoreductase [Emcibacter sp.]